MNILPSSGPRNRARRFAAVAAVTLAGLATGCNAGATWGVAGNAIAATSGDFGPATAASLNYPGPLAAAPDGGFYVGDMGDCVIRRVDASGTIFTVAGSPGHCDNTGDGGPATAALIDPGTTNASLAADSAGDVFFLQDYRSVREITAAGTIRTIATATDTFPGMAVSPDGTVYYVDFLGFSTGSRIKAIAPDGTVSTIYSTTGTLGGLALAGPSTLITTKTVNLADTGAIGRLDIATGTFTPIASGASLSFTMGFDALLTSTAAAPDGTVYVADGALHVVRIKTDGSMKIIAGNSQDDPGTAVQNGLGTTLSLHPTGLALTSGGGLLISSDHVVYRLADPEHA